MIKLTSFLVVTTFFGEYHQLLKELELERASYFKDYMRCTPCQFNELVKIVSPSILKLKINWREAISPGERLAITLR